jgi:cell division protein FtsQ
VHAALRSLEGKSLLAISAGDLAGRLERLPDVGSASYDRDFPHTIRLRVTPAHSVAVVRQGSAAWIVSSTGRVVRATHLSSAPMLPRVWVPRAVDVEVGTTIADADASRAIHALTTARSADFAIRITRVRSTEDGLSFLLATGLELRFGDAGSFSEKVAVARRILPLAGAAGYIDVSVPERPVAGDDSQVEG